MNAYLLTAPENHGNFAKPRTWAREDGELKFEGRKLVIELPRVSEPQEIEEKELIKIRDIQR